MVTTLAQARVQVDPEVLSALCRRFSVARLSLFGSVLREDFRPDSDIDVLVEFEAGQAPGYFGLGQLAVELDGLFGREVDLQTPLSLSPSFRDSVVATAEPLYAAD
jgi:uncharacterized protein